MMTKSVWCYAHGQPGSWEAICVDLDIAVQGSSFDEVKGLLDNAVRTYVQDAVAESPEVSKQLLNRRAPLWVRLKFAWAYLVHITRRNDGEMQAGFDVPCPA